MQKDILAALARLGDDDLAARVKSLTAREHATAACVIAHLAEMDTRDIHLRAGYPRLYDYCVKVLHLSEWEAWNRIEAGRVARRFPILFDMLEEGSIHLTGIKLLAPHLTEENHRGVLQSPREEQACHRGDRRPAAPAAGRADFGDCDPGVRGRAPAAGDRAFKRCAAEPDGVGRGSAHPGSGPIGSAGAAHGPDASLPAALQAPAHDQRRDAREAAPREGPARPLGAGGR